MGGLCLGFADGRQVGDLSGLGSRERNSTEGRSPAGVSEPGGE